MKNKQNVSIKGSKDGLIFLINDDCSFEDIIEELKEKLENSHQGILSGPLTRVILKTGFRKLTPNQEAELKHIFKTKGNLIIYSIENEIDSLKDQQKNQIKIITGVIRSGQVYESDTNILMLGDVNPGGVIISEGDIYVLGSLKGSVHAGSKGNTNAIIVTSVMNATQIRIADKITNFHEEHIEYFGMQCFASIKKDEIVFNKTNNLSRGVFDGRGNRYYFG